MKQAFSEELLRRAAELEIRSRKNVSALLSGNYRSAFRGSGMQFKEFRHYEPGDDIRHMSWTVTARTGKPTVKLYEEERELNVLVLVDVSGSSVFGAATKRKIDMYAELMALLGLAAVRSGDKIGYLLFHNEPVLYLPPRASQASITAGVTKLWEQELVGKKSDLRPALRYIRKVVQPRSLVVVISDFLVPDFSTEFTGLSQKHEVICLHCYDDAERGMALKGVYEVFDPESQQFLLLDVNSPATKVAMVNHHLALQSRLEDLCRKTQGDYLPLSLEDDYLQRLVHFFHRRGPHRL